MQEIQNIDKLKVISVDELRQFEGMENLSIEEAENVIEALKEIALIAHRNKYYEQSTTIPKVPKLHKAS